MLKPSDNSAVFHENADDQPMTKRKHRSESGKSLTKLFVLDTNVLMHDPTSLFRFEEHDMFLPIMTLEELDNNKKGMSEVARNARQASRYLDEIVSSVAGKIDAGIALKRHEARLRHRASCSCRPRRSTARCPNRSPWARPTTRSSAWSWRCSGSSRSAR